MRGVVEVLREAEVTDYFIPSPDRRTLRVAVQVLTV
jgi:hypothetical protein